MITPARALLLLLLSLAWSGCAAPSAVGRPTARPASRVPYVYVGGYRPFISIFRLHPSTGALEPAGQAAAGTSPSFLAWDPAGRFLFAVDEIESGRVRAFAIDGATGGLRAINDVSSAGVGPAHLSIDRDGRWVLVANYADRKSGTIATMPIAPDGKLGPVVDMRDYGPATMPHMILTDPSNSYVFVPCKGGPYIVQLGFDASTGRLTPNDPDRVPSPPGSGPRHITFHPTKDVAYVINEQAMTVIVYDFDRHTGRLTERQTIPTLPSGPPLGTKGLSTAEIAVHPNGRFVYGSNRGHNSLVIYSVDDRGALALIGHETRTIAKPRHFQIDPTGSLLLVANQENDTISVFRINEGTGALTPLGRPTSAGKQPSFVGTLFLP